MRLLPPLRSGTGKCQTRPIASAHAEQKIQREIQSRTARRGSRELHQHRRCCALLRDSHVWRYSHSHKPQAQATRRRYIPFPGSGSYAEAAFCEQAISGTGPGGAPTGLTTATRARAATCTARDRRALRLRNMWNRSRVVRQANNIACRSHQWELAGQQEGESSISLSELSLANPGIRW